MALRITAAGRTCAKTVGRRSFAAAAADHDPPLKLYGIPARYANATYTAASLKGELDMVQRDLDAFKHIIKTNANFKAYLTNPTITRSDKVTMIDNAFDPKSNTSSVTKNLLVTMAGNARLGDTEKVIDAFTQMLKVKKGEVDVNVTTAEPLTPAQEKALQTSLKAQVGEGKTVVLTMDVNPALVGGLTVQIGDKFLDLSIATKVTSIKNLMAESIANK